MAWIESHQSLQHHPKTIRLARLLKVCIPQAIGHLHCLWWWCLDYAANGDISRYESAEIAHAAAWGGKPEKLIEALAEAGFADAEAGRLLSIHDWPDYAGKLVEKRATDAERKRASRRADIRRTSDGHPMDGSRTAHVPNRTEPNRTGGGAGAGAPAREGDETTPPTTTASVYADCEETAARLDLKTRVYKDLDPMPTPEEWEAVLTELADREARKVLRGNPAKIAVMWLTDRRAIRNGSDSAAPGMGGLLSSRAELEAAAARGKEAMQRGG